jgi:hypothetical protein
MKRQVAAGAFILAIASGVGWKLASHPETSTRLQDVSLVQSSEHSQPGPTEALAGIRIRLSPSDFDDTMRAWADKVPKVAVTPK